MRSPKIICLKIQTKKRNVLKLYKGKNSFSNTHLMRIFFWPVSFQKSLLPNSLEKCSVTFSRNSPTRKLFLWCSRIFRSVRDIDHSPFTYKASRGELLNVRLKPPYKLSMRYKLLLEYHFLNIYYQKKMETIYDKC